MQTNRRKLVELQGKPQPHQEWQRGQKSSTACLGDRNDGGVDEDCSFVVVKEIDETDSPETSECRCKEMDGSA